jgi:nucleoside-diphosphate-sugar epimerase
MRASALWTCLDAAETLGLITMAAFIQSRTAVVFGGCGYIGLHLSRFLLEQGRVDRVCLVDLRSPLRPLIEGEVFCSGDVRQAISGSLLEERPQWIYNLAAVHREPGHAFRDYFDTNVPGALHVCAYAEAVGCRNLFFTASIAVYGPAVEPTDENCPKYPSTAYGISKLLAEGIHEQWQLRGEGRKLVICRPGVVYGPGDPGNIFRMIRAIRKGFFFFPGKLRVFKSYAYLDGLLASVLFTQDHTDMLIRYNYVETPTEPLSDLVAHVASFFGKKPRVLRLPKALLMPLAQVIQWLSRGRSPIHPKRVEKASTPTHIIPRWLLDQGFVFRYDFKSSLQNWKLIAPEDFR